MATNGLDGVNGVSGTARDFDAVVIGAGFSGVSALFKLRQLGLSVKVFEAGADFGGVWYWNRYPGARVDSEFPFYQLNIPEVWRTWNFSERFPGHVELRKYFAHVDKTIGLREHVQFNARVNGAQYDQKAGRWTIKTEGGHVATGKYLILASGLLHRTHYPEFPGFEDYKGTVHHSGFWPEGTIVKGKRVAIIGAGATSVQIVQELAKEADQLTMFMRRPSYCLPMGQRLISKVEQDGLRPYYSRLFREGRLSRGGWPSDGPSCGIFDVTSEQREEYLDELWRGGGFNFVTRQYDDVIFDKKANRVVYDFWAKRVRARMTDPLKQDLMAPVDRPYWFGTKRTPLEQDYYECLDQQNVEIVNMNDKPMKTFQENGILMEDGSLKEFDMVVLATGFDSFTGSLTHMGLKNKDGVDIKDLWKDGVWTYLGMMSNGFPNTFMVYSPQSPTPLSNGPTILECQLDFVVETIKRLEAQKAKSIEPTRDAEKQWKELINSMNDLTLFPLTSSWWTGGNIPGKKVESLTYIGGIDNYEKECREKLEGWQGFEVVSA